MNNKSFQLTCESRDSSLSKLPAWFVYGQSGESKPETVTGFDEGLCFAFRKPKIKK